MYKIYVIQLPWYYTKRVLAYDSEARANEALDVINADKKIGASRSHIVEMGVLEVCEESDFDKPF